MSNYIIPGVIESIQRSIRSFSRLNKVLSIIIGLFIPTIVGIYCTFYSNLVAINPSLFWLPVLLFISIAGAFSYVTWDGPLPDEVLSTYLDANEKQQKFENLIAYFTTMEALISAWRSGVDVYSLQKLTTQAEGNDAIKFVMDSLILAREPLFNFKVREMWNFAVYIYDPTKDLLVPVWRERNVGHPSVGPGRTWKPNFGHVGLAFSQREAKITPDANLPGVAALLQLPPAMVQSYDAATYVSFISQPIPRTPAGVPWGVVAATSNVQGRFNEISGLVLRHAAAELGTILSLAYTGPVPI